AALAKFLLTHSGKTVYTDNTNRYYVGRIPYSTSTVTDVYGNFIEFPFNGSITNPAGLASGGGTPGIPIDRLGYLGDSRFQYEMTNSFYWSVGASSSFYEKSAYMMYWTSEPSTTNTISGETYPYAWAYVLKIRNGEFVDEEPFDDIG